MTQDVEPLVDRDGKPVSLGRISPALRSAVTLLVTEGYTIRDAAEATGYKEHSLIQALKKPHVRALRSSVRRAWLEGRTAKAWKNVADLADSACSEDVRLKANRIFIEQDDDAAGRRTAQPGVAVQIILKHPHEDGHPLGQRLPGVIEGQARQGVVQRASNFLTVGRDDSEPEDGA